MCVQYTTPELDLPSRHQGSLRRGRPAQPRQGGAQLLHRCAEYGRMHVHRGDLKVSRTGAFLMTLDDCLRCTGAARQPYALALRGAGSKDFTAACWRRGADVAGYRGIVAYEPTSWYITARCGTPAGAEIEAALAEGRCHFEPPRFSGATGGATVACAAGLSGPRRMQAGRCAISCSASAVDGSGRSLNFGGQVMKNVAGYDVSRLLAGSLGDARRAGRGDA